MSGRCWEALTDFREWSRMFECSEGPPGCPGDPLECTGVVKVPPECPGEVGNPSWMSGRPSRMSESSWEAISNVW